MSTRRTDPDSTSSGFQNQENASERLPAELYHFSYGSGPLLVDLYYTSHKENIVFDGNTYEPRAIDRGEIQWQSDLRADSVQINAYGLDQPMQQYIAYNPLDPVSIEIIRLFPDTGLDEGLVIFTGEIMSIAFQGVQCAIRCASLLFTMQASVPRYRWQAPCNHTLFSTYCGLNKAVYAHNGTITNIVAAKIYVNDAAILAHASGYFDFGWLEKDLFRMMVTKYVNGGAGATYFEIMVPTTQLAIGNAIVAYPGCDRDINDCKNKYSNYNNYGGFPHIPKKNPATTSLI